MITLRTLHEATPQEVFDQVATHLLTQGAQCIDPVSGKCAYRAGTMMCAAGCLIADDEYKPDFENEHWTTLVRRQYAPNYHIRLISDLQSVHDRGSPSDWFGGLHQVAYRYKLNTLALDAFR